MQYSKPVTYGSYGSLTASLPGLEQRNEEVKVWQKANDRQAQRGRESEEGS
jgi:hypothetical protein